jgi:hypothetical protein
MPRYFYHTEDGSLLSDEEGSEVADDAAARGEASRLFGQLLIDEPAYMLQHKRLHVFVNNAAGERIWDLVATSE